MPDEEWQEVGSSNFYPMWDFESKPELVGRYVATRTHELDDEGEKRTVQIHDIEAESGLFVSVWGSYDLDMKLDEIKADSLVKIVYDGTETFRPKGGGPKRTIKNFRVFVR